MNTTQNTNQKVEEIKALYNHIVKPDHETILKAFKEVCQNYKQNGTDTQAKNLNIELASELLLKWFLQHKRLITLKEMQDIFKQAQNTVIDKSQRADYLNGGVLV